MNTYTHPDVLTIGVAEGWADPETDPTRINWKRRLEVALLPFPVIDNRPVNPCEKTGIERGRNESGHWGEQACADALVTLVDEAGDVWLLMVERSDGHGWAIPGGKADPGEDPVEAALRELAEETGLVYGGEPRRVFPARYVPDPRASDEAWMVTVPVWFDLDGVRQLPAVAGADDAKRAAWVRANAYASLLLHLQENYGGTVFAAHRPLLADLFS